MKKIILLLLLTISFTTIAKPLSEAQITALKEAVGKHLRDEESARYKLGDFVEPKTKGSDYKEGTGFYCGKVNSKNAYNAYVGYRDFILMFAINGNNGKLAAVVIAFSEDMDDDSIKIICKKDGYNLD